MADVAVKIFKLRVVAVYASNIAVEVLSFLGWLPPFHDDQKRIVFVGDWNAILDSKIDRVEKVWKNLIDLMAHHDLVDRFRLDQLVREMWL